MSDTRAEVLQAVANPKQFLWAPFEMAIINIVLAIVAMLIMIAVLGITPFFALIPLILGHSALTALGARNPHLTTTLQASGKYPPARRNLAPVSRGVKYTP